MEKKKKKEIDLLGLLTFGWLALTTCTMLEYLVLPGKMAGLENLMFFIFLIISLVENIKNENERGVSIYIKALTTTLFGVFTGIVLLDSLGLPQALFMSFIAFGAIGVSSVVSGAYIILTRKRREDELSQMAEDLSMKIGFIICFVVCIVFLLMLMFVFSASSEAELHSILPDLGRSFAGFSFQVVFMSSMSLSIGLVQLRNVAVEEPQFL